MGSVTKNGITVYFTGSAATGNFVVPGVGTWIEAPVDILTWDPAPTGSGASRRNGAMLNPTSIDAQGYDGREISGDFRQGYDPALDISLSLPITLLPNQALVISRSGNLTVLDLDAAVGGNQRMIAGGMVLIGVSSAPTSNTYCPHPYGATRRWITTDDIVRSLPSFPAPFNPVGAAADQMALGSGSWPGDYFRNYLIKPAEKPFNRLPFTEGDEAYPAVWAVRLNCLAHLSITDHALFANARNRLVQEGIMASGALEVSGEPGLFTASAGYGSGFFLAILYAGWLLNDATMLAQLLGEWSDCGGQYGGPQPDLTGKRVYSFAEANDFKFFPTLWSGYPLPRTRSAYDAMGGPPGYGGPRDLAGVADNESRRDPALKYDAVGDDYTYQAEALPASAGWGDYMHLASKAMVGGFIWARLTGVDGYWPPGAREYAYRWLADPNAWWVKALDPILTGNAYKEDIYGYGGIGGGVDGVGFSRALWLAHGAMADLDAPGSGEKWATFDGVTMPGWTGPPVPPTIDTASVTLRVTVD